MGDDPSRPAARRPPREFASKRPTLSFGGPPIASKEPEPEPTPRIDVIEIRQEGPFERRKRPYRPMSIDGLAEVMTPQIGWMTDDQRDPFTAAIRAADILRAHDQLVLLQERYPKNVTIKKTIAFFRAEVTRRLEEVFGGLHVIVRRTNSFPTIRVSERSRFAALIDGSTPIETILRQAKLDRLRGLEAMYAWFKSGALEVLEPAHEASMRLAARSDVSPRPSPSLAESWPPSVMDPPVRRRTAPPPEVTSAPRAGLRGFDKELDLPARVGRSTPPFEGAQPRGPRPSLEDLESRFSQFPTPVPPRLEEPADLPAAKKTTPPPPAIEVLVAASVPPAGIVEERAPKRGVTRDLRVDRDSKVEALPELDLGYEAPRSATPPPAPPSSAPPSPSELSPPSSSRPAASPELVSGPPSSTRTSPVSVRRAPATPAPAQAIPVRWWWIGGTAAVAIGVMIAVAFRSSTPAENPATTPEPGRSTPMPSATNTSPRPTPLPITLTANAPPLSSPPSASRGATIHLTLDLEPHYARVFLDGELLPPKRKDHEVLRDGKQHELRVEAVGYKKRRMKFVADADVRLVVSLELMPSSSKDTTPPKGDTPIYDDKP